MNNIKKLSAIVLLLCVVLTSLVACGDKEPAGNKGAGKFIDYASEVKLDLKGSNNIVEVKVKQLIDGDTTHFHINDPSFDGDVIKARYLAVNTPESTGQI